MADVTVEFGAQDVGLQKTLSKIQDEMAGLQTSVKSGELTMEELEKTMRRIGQVESMEKRIKAMGDASADSSPQIKNLGQQLENAGDKAKTIGGIFDAEFSKIAGAFTIGNLAAEGFQKIVGLAFDAARQVAQGFSDALDLGGRLNELSQRTGESAGKLLVLETAFKNSGLEASTVGTAINKLQNFMQDAANGSDKQRAAMQNLGVSMSDLAGKTPTEQMKIFADRIAGIEDPTARAAAASEVFGDKLGGKLLPLFSDFSGNLDDARGKVGSLEQVMDENAATFDTAAETIDAVKGKMAAFAAGLLAETIPAVRELGSEMEQVDAAGFGEAVGKILSPAVQGFTRDIQILLSILGEFKKTFTDFSSGIVGGAENFKKLSEEANKYLQVLAALLPGGLNPVNLAVKGLAATTQDLSTKTDTASESIKEVGTASQEAARKADQVGNSIASAFTINSDFKPTVDGISSGWSDLNSQIAGTKPLLESNFSLADSITGKVEEQTQSIGGQNEQLETASELKKLLLDIETKRTEKEKEAAAKQAERQAGLRENLELDLSILKAQISGNEQEVKALNYQKDYNAALKQAIDAGMGKSEAEAFADQIARARREQAGINKELTASQKLLKDIADAEAKNKIDRGGRLEKQVKDRTEAGNYAGARRASDQLARKEDRQALQDSVRGTGPGRDRRSFSDILKDYGMQSQAGDTSADDAKRILDARAGKTYADKFGRSQKVGEPIKDSLKADTSGLDRMKAKGSLKDDPRFAQNNNQAVDKPGQDGQKPPAKGDAGGKSGGKATLDGLVDQILKLVQKIEPRLPVAALV